MKPSLSLVLICLASASAIPTGIDTYSRLGDILKSGQLGDLHHVTSNGLDAIYPEELADFVDSDQFSTLNWKLYPSVDAMDLGQWETQYSSQARSDHLQPKWITEWQLPDHVDPTWDDLPDVPDEFPMPEAYIYQRKDPAN